MDGDEKGLLDDSKLNTRYRDTGPDMKKKAWSAWGDHPPIKFWFLWSHKQMIRPESLTRWFILPTLGKCALTGNLLSWTICTCLQNSTISDGKWLCEAPDDVSNIKHTHWANADWDAEEKKTKTLKQTHLRWATAPTIPQKPKGTPLKQTCTHTVLSISYRLHFFNYCICVVIHQEPHWADIPWLHIRLDQVFAVCAGNMS